VKKAAAFTFQLTREGIEARIGEMEKKTERLRSIYESFFMGMERTPPNTPRREMNRMMLEMQQVTISNSSLRFRFQSLSQKWVLLITYWNRTMREIEAGTFRRDMARTQRHLAERGGVITEEEALALGIPKNRVKAFVAHNQRLSERKGENAPKPSPSPVPAVAAAAVAAAPGRSQPPPIPASARRSPSPEAGVSDPPIQPLPGLADRDFDTAYDLYLDAHKKLGKAEEALPKEKIRQRLGKQLPKILEEKRCQQVQLDVAIEDGKVRLRAWPAENTSAAAAERK
jgi:TolA-binding protein